MPFFVISNHQIVFQIHLQDLREISGWNFSLNVLPHTFWKFIMIITIYYDLLRSLSIFVITMIVAALSRAQYFRGGLGFALACCLDSVVAEVCWFRQAWFVAYRPAPTMWHSLVYIWWSLLQKSLLSLEKDRAMNGQNWPSKNNWKYSKLSALHTSFAGMEIKYHLIIIFLFCC